MSWFNWRASRATWANCDGSPLPAGAPLNLARALSGRGRRRLFAAETPARLRLFGVPAATLVVTWAAVLVVETRLGLDWPDGDQ
jgi:hypothetical protein